jgi:MFS family permease
MHEVAAAWLMTSLAPSPLLVALVQTAATAPLFALALPGGALADVVDRRRLLLATQTWMLLVAGALAATTALGGVSPALLLALTGAPSVPD